jgi:hypothetical protein
LAEYSPVFKALLGFPSSLLAEPFPPAVFKAAIKSSLALPQFPNFLPANMLDCQKSTTPPQPPWVH